MIIALVALPVTMSKHAVHDREVEVVSKLMTSATVLFIIPRV